MADNKTVMTKRRFLQAVGIVGGSGAILAAMHGMGIGFDSLRSGPPRLSNEGQGKKILILGAGLSGMTMAYEMARRGYECEILEARSYAGGRCQTARKGFAIEELGGDRQVCDFDEGQYYNHGPWRIPPNHHSTLHYCKEFNIPIEVIINQNESCFLYNENAKGPLNGKRVRRFEVLADLNGYTSELLAKCVNQGALNSAMTGEDREQLLAYLRHSGYLGEKDMAYHGTVDRGMKTHPGAGFNLGEESDPFDLHNLLLSNLGGKVSGVPSYERPHAMFQTVGGMDRIAKGFEEQVGGMISYDCEVDNINMSPDGVTVEYRKNGSKQLSSTSADFCVSTIPLAIMSKIKGNFSAQFRDAMTGASATPNGKIGLQMNRRFWEEDDRIFGGISYTDIPGHGSIAYPSYDFLGAKGVVQGYYNFRGDAVKISMLSHAERVAFALEHGAKLHPTYKKDFSGKAFSVAWHRVPFSLSSWESWSPENQETKLKLLLEGEGRLFLSGTHMTPGLTGWMAGAIESAWLTMEKIHARVKQ